MKVLRHEQDFPSRLCVSIGRGSLVRAETLVKAHPFVELRLDLLTPGPDRAESLCRKARYVIATCREENLTPTEVFDYYRSAMRGGANWVDLDLHAPSDLRREILEEAGRRRIRVILSHHDHSRTPPLEDLLDLLRQAHERGAALTKIACHAEHPREIARLLRLLDRKRPPVVLAMGPLALPARLAALCCGSPFVYAAPDGASPTAAGQPDVSAFRNALGSWNGV